MSNRYDELTTKIDWATTRERLDKIHSEIKKDLEEKNLTEADAAMLFKKIVDRAIKARI